MYKGGGYILLLNNILKSLLESNIEQFNKHYSLRDNVLTVIDEFNVSINKKRSI